MTMTEFAKELGVSYVAVHLAIQRGRLNGAIKKFPFKGNPKRKRVEIIDVPLAKELWMMREGAQAPALVKRRLQQNAVGSAKKTEATAGGAGDEGDDGTSIFDVKLRYEAARARREELHLAEESGKLIEVETARQVFAKQIAEVKNAVMALGKHARSRIPHLSADDVIVIEELCVQALEGLAVAAIERRARIPVATDPGVAT